MKDNSQKLIDVMADFVSFVGKVLPDDVTAKLEELRKEEKGELQSMVYDTMFENQKLAVELNRASCQDTGVIQFFISCGENFPLIGKLPALLKEAVIKATKEMPLRHNSVESFDEYNTGLNVGNGTPSIFWEIVEGKDDVDIYTYMAGGGCSLPGRAKVLMPGEGYEGAAEFILDAMTSYGLNACPPLLVGVGIGTSVETAALNSKKALMKDVNAVNPNANAHKMEVLLEEAINNIGLGPQGFGGKKSVLGVNIVNTARHPSAIGVAVNVGCWSHRRGLIHFDKDLNYTIKSHKGAKL
ncbi:MAG: L(+)-tartrate dehydratase subunit alpha [Christensenellaceae bacterium]|nr:L(+)-tartrate dehydratase subunit alpha [Christensenellaceae bacterium]